MSSISLLISIRSENAFLCLIHKGGGIRKASSAAEDIRSLSLIRLGYVAGWRRLQTGKNLEKCGFARTVFTYQRNFVGLVDYKTNIREKGTCWEFNWDYLLMISSLSNVELQKLNKKADDGNHLLLNLSGVELHHFRPRLPFREQPSELRESNFFLVCNNTHSVVGSIPAMLDAFSRATRVTLAGSMTPVEEILKCIHQCGRYIQSHLHHPLLSGESQHPQRLRWVHYLAHRFCAIARRIMAIPVFFHHRSRLWAGQEHWDNGYMRRHRRCTIPPLLLLHVWLKGHRQPLSFSLSSLLQMEHLYKDCDTTGKFCKTFLKFLLVIVWCGSLDLCLYLVDARPEIASLEPAPLTMIVLSLFMVTFSAVPRSLTPACEAAYPWPRLLQYRLSIRRYPQAFLFFCLQSGSFDRTYLERAAKTVHNKSCKCFVIHILRNYKKRATGLRHSFKNRKHVFKIRNFSCRKKKDIKENPSRIPSSRCLPTK